MPIPGVAWEPRERASGVGSTLRSKGASSLKGALGTYATTGDVRRQATGPGIDSGKVGEGRFLSRDHKPMRTRKTRTGSVVWFLVPRTQTPYGARAFGALRSQSGRSAWTPPRQTRSRPYLYNPTRIALTFLPISRFMGYPLARRLYDG